MKISRVICLGGGDLCREFISLFSQSNFSRDYFYLDNEKKEFNKKGIQPNYLGKIEEFEPLEEDELFLTISSPRQKEDLINKNPKLNAFMKTFIHPTSIVSKSSLIGKGCIIYPFTYISANSKIMDFVTINSYSGIGHDSVVGKFSTLSAQIDLAGHSSLGKGCFMGSGSRIIPSKKIGDYSTIGASSLITRNLPSNSRVFGEPEKKY